MNLLVLLFGLLFSASALAVCPICTFAVGAGIGLSQYFGIDDTITGIWIGGFIVSLIAWTIAWLDKRNIRFFGRKIIIVLAYYAITIIPLYFQGLIGHTLNKFWGMDKILFGIIIGSIAFFAGHISYVIMKKQHNDKAYFPFQKVVMPVVPLIILSGIFYYLTKI